MNHRLTSSLRLSLVAPALAALAVVACGGSTSSAPPSLSQATSDVASAYCAKLGSCSPFSLQVAYLDEPTCVTLTTNGLAQGTQAPGTGETAAALEACAQAYGAVSCAALQSGVEPAECQFHGTVTDGAACSDGAQCGSGRHCAVPQGATCGTCAADLTAGATCTATDFCPVGMECIFAVPDGGVSSTSGTCVVLGAEGASCGGPGQGDCSGGLACVQGKCGAPLALGAACDPLDDLCDYGPGLTCDATSKTCVKEAVAAPGAPCGLLNGVVTLCGGLGSSCAAGATASAPSTCVAAIAVGKACGAGATGAGFCEVGSSCVNEVCTVVDPATCH